MWYRTIIETLSKCSSWYHPKETIPIIPYSRRHFLESMISKLSRLLGNVSFCRLIRGCRFVPYTFSDSIRHRWYQAGSRYWWVPRVWRLDSGPNLQPCNSIPLENKLLLIFINFTLETSLKKWYTMFSRPLHTPMPSYAYVLSLKSGLEFWQSGALYHQSDDQLLHGTGVRTSTWVTTSKHPPKV